MRINHCLLVLSVLLIGCANDDAPDETPSGATEPVAADPEYQWAADLINGSAQWEPVTVAAVPADYTRYGLCRRRIPGVDDHGPHSANYESWKSDYAEDPHKNPANQFIVNPIGRSHFYDASDQIDKIAAVPAPLPAGTVIVKEKYDQIEDANNRTNPKAFGVMIKKEPGYDAEHNDWEYAYIEIDSEKKITAATRGKLANCIDCHANREHTDYVFRNYPLLTAPK